MPFAPRRGAGRSFAYWRSEQRTLRQRSVALLIGTLAARALCITTSSIIPALRLPIVPSLMERAGVFSLLLVLPGAAVRR